MKRLFLSSLVMSLFFAAACSSGDQADSSAPDGYPNDHCLRRLRSFQNLKRLTRDFLLVDARADTVDSVITGAVRFPAVSSLIDDDHPIDFYMVGS